VQQIWREQAALEADVQRISAGGHVDVYGPAADEVRRALSAGDQLMISHVARIVDMDHLAVVRLVYAMAAAGIVEVEQTISSRGAGVARLVQ